MSVSTDHHFFAKTANATKEALSSDELNRPFLRNKTEAGSRIYVDLVLSAKLNFQDWQICTEVYQPAYLMHRVFAVQ